MFKYAVPFVALLLCVVSLAQQTPNKPQAKKAPESSAKTPDPTLSKDYRKSAIAAVSSILDWKEKSQEVSTSTGYRHGASRSSIEREADAGEKAKKDVKTAKVDVTTPADQFLQTRLETFLDSVSDWAYHMTNLGSPLPDKVIDTMSTCNALIAKALDDGSTVVFEEHPDSKCE
jgi:hypothetical protein